MLECCAWVLSSPPPMLPPLPSLPPPFPFAPFPCVPFSSSLTSGKALLVRVQARDDKGVIEEVV
jgi:hypothetical protein